MEESKLIFISGGVRSGKSSFAESIAINHAKMINGNLHYLACGKATDPEMLDRIAHHKETRNSSELPWTNWECPTNIGKLSPNFKQGDVILLDCLTTLLNNELFIDERAWEKESYQEQIYHAILEDIKNIRDQCSILIIVSNEVFNEVLPKSEIVFAYERLLGYLHQSITKQSSSAYLIESGLPHVMKGEVNELC